MTATTSTAGSAALDPWKAFSGAHESGPLARVLALDDFEPLARRRLPRAIFGYVAGAAETRASLHANRDAFGDWAFVPRVLRNVAGRSQATTLFGREWAAPFGIAPMGIAALSAYDGDRVLARAAAAAGIPFVLSGTSLTRMEDVMGVAPGSWFQAYLPGDTARIDALIERVRRAGVRTLVLTVDIPVAGNRENNIRAGFSTPLRPSLGLAWDGLSHPRWLLGTLARTLLARGMPHFENSFAERGAPVISRHVERDFSRREHLDLSHAARIRCAWAGELVIKGVLHPGDVAAARELGADGVILSNHGGRQLDGAVSPLRMLPRAVEAAGGMPVMIDGGIRRGSDVLKALALGANFVFLGRPFNYAACVAGEPGVARAITLLREEIDRNLAMLGVTTPQALGREFLHSLHP
jgi:L-lactate dehydrogenase (cytochrome)